MDVSRWQRAAVACVWLGIGCGVAATAKELVRYDFADAVQGQATVDSDEITALAAIWVGMSGRAGFGGEYGDAYVQTSSLPQPPEVNSFGEGRYLEITVKAKPGFVIDLSSLTFKFGGTNASENSRILRTTVKSSLNDYADGLNVMDTGRSDGTASLSGVKQYAPNVIGGGVPSNTESPVMVTLQAKLDSAYYQSRNEVTFRFYTSVSGRGSRIYARYDDIVIEGSVRAAGKLDAQR